MAITFLPGKAYVIAATHDGRYIYYLGKTFYIYDTQQKQKIQTLPKLGNACCAVSPYDHYVGFAHPKRNCISGEVVIYRIGETHEELFRVHIPGEPTQRQVCFTADEQYLLVTSGYPQNKLWAVSTHTGYVNSFFETEGNERISTEIIANKNGIFLHLHCYDESKSFSPFFRMLHFPSIEAEPREIIFNKESHIRHCIKNKTAFSSEHVLAMDHSKIFYCLHLYPCSCFQILDVLKTNEISVAPDAYLPMLYVTGTPRISNDGKYFAAIFDTPGVLGNAVRVFRTSDWKQIAFYKDEYLWHVEFMPNTHRLLVASNRACIIDIEDKER